MTSVKSRSDVWLMRSPKVKSDFQSLSGQDFKSYIVEVLDRYNFIECAHVIDFILIFCSFGIEINELEYIEKKVHQCLKNHDNGSDFFSDLRSLHLVLKLGK